MNQAGENPGQNIILPDLLWIGKAFGDGVRQQVLQLLEENPLVPYPELLHKARQKYFNDHQEEFGVLNTVVLGE